MTAKRDHGPEYYHGPTSEIVGFLCRWLLLGGAATLISLVAWESLLATVGVSRDVHSRFVVVDAVGRAGAGDEVKCRQRGLVTGPRSPSGTAVVLAACPAQPLAKGVRDRDDGFWIRWAGCRAGSASVVCQGVPYGALAFERRTARILGVPDGRPVTLVDVRLARAAARTQPAVWRRTLAAMANAGEVGLFFDGPTEGYGPVLAEYRRSGGEMPVLFSKGRMPYLFTRIARDLARRKNDGISIVTSDAALAGKLARAGFVVHLIAPSAAAAQPSRSMVRHGSLERFKDSLPTPPIRH